MQAGFDAVDEAYGAVACQFFGDDIVEQPDGFREFAFTPKRHHEEISETAQQLYDAELLVPGEPCPLHVTLGGIAAKNSSWLILAAVEMSGGATTERIKEIGTWSQKGLAGIRQRGARELSLDAKVAIEMRSLVSNGPEQLAHVLEIAQTAGSLLLARDRGEQSARVAWKELYSYLMLAFEEKSVNARQHWKNPQHDHTPWLSLGAALEDEAWSQSVKAGIEAILLS